MATFGKMLLAAIGGYAVGVPLGIWLVITFSSNQHDRSVEAAMTAVFVFGPLGAIAAMIAAWVWWVS